MTVLDDSASLMVCAPGFTDTRYEKQDYYFETGRCILIDEIKKENITVRPFSDVRQYFEKFHEGDKDITVFKYAYAGFGMSTDSNKNGVVAVGAPGVWFSEGCLFISERSVINRERTLSSYSTTPNLDTTAYSYLGYSVKMGHFCNSICVAAGAPGEYSVGAVHIYKWDSAENRLFEMDVLKGTQPWAFFGSSLTAADFDGDGYDEIVVGAPYFTGGQTGTDQAQLDQGRAFIYGRGPTNSRYMLIQELVGSNSPFSKFGVSVQAIGDINLDGNPDLAVGAPWEDEGAGCVYIFLGKGQGVREQYSQRITAAELPQRPRHPLKGLGFALSNFVLPNGQGSFPMFSATAISSSSVITFTGRPIVTASIELRSADVIEDDNACSDTSITEPCFDVTAFLEYKILGKSIFQLDFELILNVDTRMTTAKRATFRLEDGTNSDSLNFTANNVRPQGKSFPFNVVVAMARVEKNRITPVTITAEYRLLDTKPSHPILNMDSSHQVEKSLSFRHQCGPNNLCDVDLKTVGSLSFTSKGSGGYDFIVVNGTSELIVNLTVSNSGEISYFTQVDITVDTDLPYLQGPANCKAEEENPEGQSKVACLQKVLREGGQFNIAVTFDTSDFPLDRQNVKVKAKAMPQDLSQNKDKAPQDNTIELMTSVAMISTVVLQGSALPSEVTANNSRPMSVSTKVDIDDSYVKTDLDGEALNVTHRALVINTGPSFLPGYHVHVAVPFFSLDGTQVLQDATVQVNMTDGSLIKCDGTFRFDEDIIWTDRPTPTISTTSATSAKTTTTPAMTTEPSGSTTTEFIINGGGPNKRKKRSAQNDEQPTKAESESQNIDLKIDPSIYVMSCKLDPNFCKYYTCKVPNSLPPDQYVTVDVAMLMEKKNIPIPQGFSGTYFMTTIQVSEPEHPLLKPWDSTPEINLYTSFSKKKPSDTINIWIIVGSVAGGLVLITIITIILWKCGFFKRDKHYQVERWKHESIRRSRHVSTPKPDS